MKPPKAGPQPNKGGDKNRNFRVSDEEWEAWMETARADGLSLSAWLRKLANREHKRRAK